MEKITAAGGVVYNNRKVLLIFRRGIWDLPKGKLEEGETIEECAVREVAEEIGVSRYPKIMKSLTETYHEYNRNGIQFGKTTYWFGMQLADIPTDGFHPQTAEGIEKVEWVEFPDVKSRVGYDNLFKVLARFEKLIYKDLS